MHNIIIISEDRTITIDIRLLKEGTFLHTLLYTELPKNINDDGEYTLDDIPYDVLVAYKDFLEFGTDFEWDEDMEEWFRYLGHTNTLQYPNDFWKVKLIDDRVREYWNYGFRQEKLITINKHLVDRVDEIMSYVSDSLPKGHYIAGGAALYIAGITDSYSDIDIFTTNRMLSEQWIRNYNNDYIAYSENSLSFISYVGKRRKQVQLILREYTSPSEIIHGFDIGSCSILYDPMDSCIKTTYKGSYCINKGVNWFEPDRSSPTYAYRLSKYHLRGFRVMLPCSGGLTTNIASLRKSILHAYFDDEHVEYEKYIGYQFHKNYVNQNTEYEHPDRRLDLKKHTPIWGSEIAIALNEIRYKLNIHKSMIKYYWMYKYSNEQSNNEIISLITETIDSIPKDPMSIIVLACCYSISTNLLNIKNKSDYSGSNVVKFTNTTKLAWKVINPMEQSLTGSFYPEPIVEDIRKFYLSSPLVRELEYSSLNTTH